MKGHSQRQFLRLKWPLHSIRQHNDPNSYLRGYTASAASGPTHSTPLPLGWFSRFINTIRRKGMFQQHIEIPNKRHMSQQIVSRGLNFAGNLFFCRSILCRQPDAFHCPPNVQQITNIQRISPLVNIKNPTLNASLLDWNTSSGIQQPSMTWGFSVHLVRTANVCPRGCCRHQFL